MPRVPTSAAAALTLRSPASLLLAVHAEKLPDSNPSAKIRSDTLDVFVTVGVFDGVNVAVGVSVLVGVGEGPVVGVFVGVKVCVGVDFFVDVLVGVGVGNVPDPIILKASTSLALCPQALPSK